MDVRGPGNETIICRCIAGICAEQLTDGGGIPRDGSCVGVPIHCSNLIHGLHKKCVSQYERMCN